MTVPKGRLAVAARARPGRSPPARSRARRGSPARPRRRRRSTSQPASSGASTSRTRVVELVRRVEEREVVARRRRARRPRAARRRRRRTSAPGSPRWRRSSDDPHRGVVRVDHSAAGRAAASASRPRAPEPAYRSSTRACRGAESATRSAGEQALPRPVGRRPGAAPAGTASRRPRAAPAMIRVMALRSCPVGSRPELPHARRSRAGGGSASG